MTVDESVGVDEVRATIERLLSAPSDVVVLAVDERGAILPVPAGVPGPSVPASPTHSALDLFVAEDCQTVVDVWRRLQAQGAGCTTVRLAGRPRAPISLHVADLRDSRGAMLAVLSGPGLTPADVTPVDVGDPGPLRCVLRQDATMTVVDADEAATAMFGWSRGEMVGTRTRPAVHPDDWPAMLRAWVGATATGRPREVRLRRLHQDGSSLWVACRLTSHLDDPADPHVVAEMVDVSDQMAAVTELRERDLLLARLTEALPEGVFQVDRDRRVVYANDRLRRILQTGSTDDLDRLLASVIAVDRRALDAALSAVLTDGVDRDLEVNVVVADVWAERRCLVDLRALVDAAYGVTGAVVCVSEITEASLMRRELEERATYDRLTHCHNRASVMDILRRAVSRPEGTTAVFSVDIDGFKAINDQFGQAAGDELLVTLAYRLHAALRRDDAVGRVGGDEFLVVCPDVRGQTDAEAIAARIRGLLSEEALIAGHTVTVSCSMGAAWSGGPVDGDELVRRVERALVESKQRGRGVPVFYHDERESAPPAGQAVRSA